MKRSGGIMAAATLAGALAAMGQAPKADWSARGNAWWAHIQHLASDKLEGRGTGTKGFEKAAKYVEKQFKKSGLQPAGINGYRQPVEFNVAQLDEAHSSLELIRNGNAEAVKFGDEAFLSVNSATADKVEGDAVFVGYGLSIPEMNYDDLAGQDLRGKIVVYLTGGPSGIPGPVLAHFQSREERDKAFEKAGVAGVAVIPNPESAEVPWSRIAGSRFEARMELAEAGQQPEAARGPKVRIIVNPKYADNFLAGSGHSFASIVEEAREKKSLPHFPLAVRIRSVNGVKRSQVRSENIAGVMPGSDPALKNEYVVVSAHLDHLGIGTPVNGDGIYNGAMDDASGVASVIEIARLLKASGKQTKRSILFLTVTGEEKGELGSEYFAKHPTVKGRIAADINMDMYLPLFPLKYLEVQGLDESTLGEDIRAIAAVAGVQVQADKEPEHNRFIRSDQYSFIKQGVPALAFKFGWVPGSEEQKIFQAWYVERYHAPSDDLSQPVDKEAAAQFDAILQNLVVKVADDQERPEWNKTSFFRRFAKGE